MKKRTEPPHQIATISELHNMLHLKGPANPLGSVINHDDVIYSVGEFEGSLSYNFYMMSLKKTS